MPSGDPTDTINYYNTPQDEQSWRQALVGNISGADHVYRERWKFDENGFALATNAAVLQAQQAMREKIRSINDDLVATYNPIDYDVTVDGVPIDKVNFAR